MEFKRSESGAMLQTNEGLAIPLGGPVDPERLRMVARMCVCWGRRGEVGWWVVAEDGRLDF